MADSVRRRHASPVRRPESPAEPTGSGRWWQIRWCRGMYRDVRRRLPFYLSDWTDAADYRVVPATVYMYFTNILPALAFSLDMFAKTGMTYGVNEVLLSSVVGSGLFGLFAAQPLVIVGVTGPITVFNYTVYDIISSRQIDYLAFMAWIGLWALLFHVVLAVSNSCVALRFVTKLPCDTFGIFVAIVYLEKGVEVLIRQFEATQPDSSAAAYLSIVLALLVLLLADTLSAAFYTSSLLRPPVRKFVQDYSLPLTVVFLSGMANVGKMASVPLEKLPTAAAAFQPTGASPQLDQVGQLPIRTGWVIPFWRLSGADVALALPFGFLLTVLFWFDHNVSSLISQASVYPLRKPAGFHWDIFLLGITTGLTGIIGVPFPNGLIPQAPFHTESLCVYPDSKQMSSSSSTSAVAPPGETVEGDNEKHDQAEPACAPAVPFDSSVPIRVVEQRVSNLAQGLITLFTMSGPALTALRQIPQGVLAGMFFVMGLQALRANEITRNIGLLLRDPRALLSSSSPSSGQDVWPCFPVGRFKRSVVILLAIEIGMVALTFALTHTVVAIGFPLLFAVLIPARHFKWLVPALIRDRSILDQIDGPIASSKTMEGVYVDRPLSLAPVPDRVREAEAGSSGWSGA